jgi:ankyrin repeat protein
MSSDHPTLSTSVVSTLSEPTEVKETELFLAIAENNIAEVQKILDSGVNINHRSHEVDVSPLKYAAKNGYVALSRMLLERDAKLGRYHPNTASCSLQIVRCKCC